MNPQELLWDLSPVQTYPFGFCFAAHGAHLHTFWSGDPTSMVDFVACSPPSGFGGDPWTFFRDCAPSLQALETHAPSDALLVDHLLRGPLLVARKGHALTLRGYTPTQWLLLDAQEIRLDRSVAFDYAIGI